jgi:hypothetical protein
VPFAHDGERARTSRVADLRGLVRRSGTPAAGGRRLGDRTTRHAQARCLSRRACAGRIALFPSPRAARGPTPLVGPRGSECSPPTVKACGVDPRTGIRVDLRKSASRGVFGLRLPCPGIARPGRRADQRRVRQTATRSKRRPPNFQLPNVVQRFWSWGLPAVACPSIVGQAVARPRRSARIGTARRRGDWELTVIEIRCAPVVSGRPGNSSPGSQGQRPRRGTETTSLFPVRRMPRC